MVDYDSQELQKEKVAYNGLMAIPASMQCDCLRCGHHWLKRMEGRPARCPKCTEHDWDLPKGQKAMGRPGTKAGKKKG